MIQLQGPSKAILRDFSVRRQWQSVDGIEVTDADQAGSRVFMEQAILSRSQPNLFVDGLDYTNVELHDFYSYYFADRRDERQCDGGAVSRGRSLAGRRNQHLRRRFNRELRQLWGSRTARMLRYGISGTTPAARPGCGRQYYRDEHFQLCRLGVKSAQRPPLAISLDNFQGTAALVNLDRRNGGHRISPATAGPPRCWASAWSARPPPSSATPRAPRPLPGS